MKTNRLALIAALCGAVQPTVMQAAASEIAEEATLAGANRDDDSTLDESDNLTVISPMLRDVVEIANSNPDALELSAAERREVGALVRFVKVAVVESDESPVPQDLDYEGLANWANEVAPLEVAAI